MIQTRALVDLGADRIVVSLTALSGGRGNPIMDAVRCGLDGVPETSCVDDSTHSSGRGYYPDFCFKVHARFGGDGFETSDRGSVDWTQPPAGSAKVRCFVSGIGLDALRLASPRPNVAFNARRHRVTPD